eukprot:457335-Amorphochlora_amoeboformis.AAC.1
MRVPKATYPLCATIEPSRESKATHGSETKGYNMDLSGPSAGLISTIMEQEIPVNQARTQQKQEDASTKKVRGILDIRGPATNTNSCSPGPNLLRFSAVLPVVEANESISNIHLGSPVCPQRSTDYLSVSVEQPQLRTTCKKNTTQPPDSARGVRQQKAMSGPFSTVRRQELFADDMNSAGRHERWVRKTR